MLPCLSLRNLIQTTDLMIVENKNTRCSCIIRLPKSSRSVKKVVFEIRPPNKAPKKIKIPR